MVLIVHFDFWTLQMWAMNKNQGSDVIQFRRRYLEWKNKV